MRAVISIFCFALAISVSSSVNADPSPAVNPSVLPSHSNICAGSRVHKAYLIGFILTKINNAKNQEAQVLMAASTELQARLFTDDASSFCQMATKPRCSAGPADKDCVAATTSCLAYQGDAVKYAQYFFKNLNKENARADAAYTESTDLRSLQPYEQVNKYFDYRHLNDEENPIICNKVDIPPSPSTAQKDNSALGKFRVRGRSDDLYIDRSFPQFKSTTPASINWTGSDGENYVAKVVGSLGYEVDVGADGQLIPYFAFSQSVTAATGKANVLDPTNNVAAGFLATSFFGDPNSQYLQHVVTIKPQYLFNTSDQSQIASMRLIYAPWTSFPNSPINFNTFHMLPFLAQPTWFSLLFDLRNDSGSYTNRGNTPAVIAVNKDFDRMGTRVGLTLTTDPAFPSFTVTVAETYLYGLVGYYKSLDLFESSITYNFESNNYLGITASYKKGRDEDTAVSAKTWTLGLTARY
jgi:hypothetical protein